ncbi:MAG: DUF2917 domain-containing protein [Polaromonas sp.]|nr:DUF2917 domain-containing protein [Polaromonas sp.]
MQHTAIPQTDSHLLSHATDAGNGRVDGLAGCWKLAAGRALTVRASQAGELRIAHGRVWATFDLANGDSAVRAGDHFLSRGESLVLEAGQQLVLESFGLGHASSAYFSWEPATAGAPATAGNQWQSGVLQPLADLRAAAGLAGRAVGRLSTGVVRGGLGSVTALLTPLATGFVAARAARQVREYAPGDAVDAGNFYYAERARKADVVRADGSRSGLSLQRFAV